MLSYSSEDQGGCEAQSEEEDYGLVLKQKEIFLKIVYIAEEKKKKFLAKLCENVFTDCMPVLSCTFVPVCMRLCVDVCVCVTAGLLGLEEVRDSPGLCRPSRERTGDESILDEPENHETRRLTLEKKTRYTLRSGEGGREGGV